VPKNSSLLLSVSKCNPFVLIGTTILLYVEYIGNRVIKVIDLFSGNIVKELPLAILSVVVTLAGIWISNIVYDRGVPNYISRKIGHLAGGIAFLIAFFLSTPGWAIIIASSFGVLLLVARLVRPEILRGVGGTGRNNKVLAEVWFPWVAVPIFIISWLWLNKPAVSVACLLFMAWGDGITGLIRSIVYRKAVKGVWGSLAMLCVCLLIAGIFIKPFWIGAVASVMAVIVERTFGEYGIFKWGDDNWAIPLASMATILGLMALIGIS
jgi:phytol kinase